MMVTAAMAIAAVVMTAMREVASPRWGDVMVVCDSNNARGCMVKNTSASTTVEQFSCTWAALRANGDASHAGLMEKPEGRRGIADMDVREVGPSSINTHK
jgi:uncharacterized protein YhfF